ncbi:MAG: hypothetical protein IT348_19880, partial [Candidatus Eisenbacteria bacterium]|nr:hypothetical protein [Candidatus Eisenbacteria bacterium]
LDKLVAATEPAADSRQVAYAPVTDEAFTALRGIGGMAPSAPASTRESKLQALASQLRNSSDGAFWVRQLTLESR